MRVTTVVIGELLSVRAGTHGGWSGSARRVVEGDRRLLLQVNSALDSLRAD